MTAIQSSERRPALFAALIGAFFGLALLKFGNPPIMEKWVSTPTNAYEFVLNSPWPIAWGYWVFAAIAGIGLTYARKTRWVKAANGGRLLAGLPLAWLTWQIIATSQSLDGRLSAPTLRHFLICTTCFYLGFFSLRDLRSSGLFWGALLCGLACVLFSGWQQHFGGLEETRRYFFQYIYPKMPEVSPDYLKKMSSNRIFATLFYPNALAGALLLLLPPAEMAIWRAERRLTRGARQFVMAVFGIAALACLFWSGSKGGWLLMLLLALIALMRWPFPRRIKLLIIFALLGLGLVGFFLKYASFFEKGATSVSARFDYWRAALQTTLQHPLLGTGPGTFAIPYQRLKRPESEMTRLVHNDYLEQASDSGLIGAVLYLGLVAGSLIYSFRRATAESNLSFAMWLGVLGWGLQGLFEFGLYIPALAWPAFTFLGWLLSLPPSDVNGCKSEGDKKRS